MICAHIWIYIGMAVCFWRPWMAWMAQFTVPKMTNLRFKDLQNMGIQPSNRSWGTVTVASAVVGEGLPNVGKAQLFSQNAQHGGGILITVLSIFIFATISWFDEADSTWKWGPFPANWHRTWAQGRAMQIFSKWQDRENIATQQKIRLGWNMHKHAQTIMICRYANRDCSWRTWNAHDWPRTYPAADP